MTHEQEAQTQERPKITKDGKPFVYINKGDDSSLVDCPFLGLHLGASMPQEVLKRTFEQIASVHAHVILGRVQHGEDFPKNKVAVCRRILENTHLPGGPGNCFEYVE